MNKYFIEEEIFSGIQIGYTDFVKIYLNRRITGKYLEVLRIHECSHIWLQHNIRAQHIDNLNVHIWNVACDLEIAKHIYSTSEDSIINSVRSPLKGGITHVECQEFPDCKFAEQYYLELLKKEVCFKNINIDMTSENLNAIIIPCDKAPVNELIISETKEKIKQLRRQGDQIVQQNTVNNFQAPSPSLASELDAIRRSRTLISRVKSFKRPNRKEFISEEFFKKGFRNVLKQALVTLYVDRSGSFSAEKTHQANIKVKLLLLKYRGILNLDTIFFNDSLKKMDPLVGGGGTNYKDVVDHINHSESSLSIIITDDDRSESCLVTTKKIIIYPIGCSTTHLAKILKVKEVRS